MLGLCFCARTFSSCGKWGPLSIAVCRPLTIAASLVAEHRLQTCRLSSCGSRAQLLRGMWDLPRPGLEPVSPALASRFSTTAPPGKPYTLSLIMLFLSSQHIPLPFFLSYFLLFLQDYILKCRYRFLQETFLDLNVLSLCFHITSHRPLS